jgi:hypothetical protein
VRCPCGRPVRDIHCSGNRATEGNTCERGNHVSDRGSANAPRLKSPPTNSTTSNSLYPYLYLLAVPQLIHNAYLVLTLTDSCRSAAYLECIASGGMMSLSSSAASPNTLWTNIIVSLYALEKGQ